MVLDSNIWRFLLTFCLPRSYAGATLSLSWSPILQQWSLGVKRKLILRNSVSCFRKLLIIIGKNRNYCSRINLAREPGLVYTFDASTMSFVSFTQTAWSVPSNWCRRFTSWGNKEATQSDRSRRHAPGTKSRRDPEDSLKRTWIPSWMSATESRSSRPTKLSTDGVCSVVLYEPLRFTWKLLQSYWLNVDFAKWTFSIRADRHNYRGKWTDE